MKGAGAKQDLSRPRLGYHENHPHHGKCMSTTVNRSIYAAITAVVVVVSCTPSANHAHAVPDVTGTIAEADHVERVISIHSDAGETTRIGVSAADVHVVIGDTEVATGHLALEPGARVTVWLRSEDTNDPRAQPTQPARAERVVILGVHDE